VLPAMGAGLLAAGIAAPTPVWPLAVVAVALTAIVVLEEPARRGHGHSPDGEL
jgi:hypothetical protein